MLDRLQFLFSEALVALRRNGFMTLAAVSTVAVSLFLVGGLGYAYLRVNAFADKLPKMFDVLVFLKDGTKQPEISKTANAIRAMPNVAEAVWIPRAKAWEKEKQKLPEVMEDMENPLPDALRVKMSDLEGADVLTARIAKLPHVLKVASDTKSQQAVQGLLSVLRWLGGVLGGLLFLTGGILIHNAIRMTIVARRREIRIMQLVGAGQATIRTPFLIEGVLQGALGGLLAGFLIWPTSLLFVKFVQENSTFDVSPFPIRAGFFVLCAIGAGYGFLCSLLATLDPLKLR
jgi:cell division transport system permease protein